jgi:hypothetical protein
VGSRGGDRERVKQRERDAVGERKRDAERQREDPIDCGPAPKEQVRLWVVDWWPEVRFSVAKIDFRRGRGGSTVPVEQGWRRSELRTPEMR